MEGNNFFFFDLQFGIFEILVYLGLCGYLIYLDRFVGCFCKLMFYSS